MEQHQELLNLYYEDKNNYPQEEYILFHTNPLYDSYELTIKRNLFGAYCVYVKLPNNHPDIGKDYDDIDLDVHGGLTYGNHNTFGIDFSHIHDFNPEFLIPHPDPLIKVWTFDEVKAEGFKMIEQFFLRA
jgi:hypothetical protein